MGYVAVQGGQQAIEFSNALLKARRVSDGSFLEADKLETGLRSLIDQVMSEASLYAPKLAALALKQACGSMEEAVFLLRAHRSTLPRLYYSSITEPREMLLERRISASFKDIPGGQILGETTDFTQRFLDFGLRTETAEDAANILSAIEEFEYSMPSAQRIGLPKVIDYLEDQGLYEAPAPDDTPPRDITKESIRFPSSRSERLQTLTRGQTGAVTSLGYAQIRSYGIGTHPNIGELRVGRLPIRIDASSDTDEYYLGSIRVTEVESFIPSDITVDGSTEIQFMIGYGLCYGQNESKAIAMSILDYTLEHKTPGNPASDEEFVLLHIDSVESTGFISHLKLPHYVTFQSLLDGTREIAKKKESNDEL